MAEMSAVPNEFEWLRKRFEKEAKKDVLPKAERFGQLAAIVFIGIFIVFFESHLAMNTGFFRPNFGAFELLLFFGIAAYGILPTLMKFILGRKNRVRPFEFVSNVLTIIAAIYFLVIWPFDFSHVVDVLPGDFQPIISWLSDSLMQLLIAIGIPILCIATIIEVLTYFGVKQALEKSGPQPAIEPLKKTQ